MNKTLTDRFSRRIEYLRLSVTDRCNLRCVYCMPEKMHFLPRREVLSAQEHIEIAACFAELGVRKIRLTGGEPLLRTDILTIVEGIAQLPQHPEVVLSTNGVLLKDMAGDLYRSGVKRANISLDSLDPIVFGNMTRNGHLDEVLAGIDAAIAAGMAVRINAVLLKGMNEHEAVQLVEYARDKRITIAFIEEMPLGEISHHDRNSLVVSNETLKAQLIKRFELIPTTESTGGPAYYYRSMRSQQRVGFISPHTHNFCDKCNRIRVTADARLITCLGHEGAPSLRDYMGDRSRMRQVILQELKKKPQKHHFFSTDHPAPVRWMNMTGG